MQMAMTAPVSAKSRIIAKVEIAGKAVPLAGRVSMDLLIADVTSLSNSEIASASKACLIGAHYSLLKWQKIVKQSAMRY